MAVEKTLQLQVIPDKSFDFSSVTETYQNNYLFHPSCLLLVPVCKFTPSPRHMVTRIKDPLD